MSIAFFRYDDNGVFQMGLTYEYDLRTNKLILSLIKVTNFEYKEKVKFSFEAGMQKDKSGFNDEMKDFLQFLNQPVNDETRKKLTLSTEIKEFNEVWSRDRIHFHASFSTSRRRFIGKRDDFYQNLTLLYPPPTNESTFCIRFTSNRMKNILIRWCEFDIQLFFLKLLAIVLSS